MPKSACPAPTGSAIRCEVCTFWVTRTPSWARRKAPIAEGRMRKLAMGGRATEMREWLRPRISRAKAFSRSSP
jgi:hypothetical protein